jgi:neutral ceramidase
MAMVSCDLWAIPAGLADKAAELAITRYGADRLGREQIVIAATHTHHSPGNFSSSRLYNTLASPEHGFDRELFDFLADRIAWVIAEAWKNRKPAVLKRSATKLVEIARNRSLKPFLKNGRIAFDILEENKNLPIHATPFPVGGEQAYRAVDATLTVIRAEDESRGSSDPQIAVMAFYAVHPTAMGPPTQVYSSDLFGVATTLLEQEYKNSVVGIFNGASGDVSSNWERRDRPATMKLGNKLAQGINRAMEMDGEVVSGPIKFGFDRCSMGELEPMVGASMLAGSEGDWVFLRDVGFEEGMVDPNQTRIDHKPKMDPLPEHLVKPWVKPVLFTTQSSKK